MYNADGLRVQKTVNGMVTKYTLHGKNVVHMTQGSNELHFFYDAANKPAVVVYNGTAYAYVKNLQGDIIAILDANGNVVVQYAYDAWGKPISTTGSMASTLGAVQPFRYRGYVYDQESALYYLRSRYYNPMWCRFTNADVLYKHNTFAYALQNPTNSVDDDGKDAIWIQERNSAAEMGHSGLLVQDAKGVWHYFFWGPVSEDLNKELVMGTPQNTYIEPIQTSGVDMYDLNSVIAAIEASVDCAPNASCRAKLITEMCYFEGDYTATYDKAVSIVDGSDDYQLLTNNCVQKTVEAFRASDWRFYLVGSSISSFTIPNLTFLEVQMIPTKKGEFPFLLILDNIVSY